MTPASAAHAGSMASVNSGNSTEKATGAAKPRTEFNLQESVLSGSKKLRRGGYDDFIGNDQRHSTVDGLNGQGSGVCGDSVEASRT
jgi:hypothetical protein